MSDTKNHKLAIKAIIEAHRTPGKMREIMLTILADKPSAIVNAWEEVKRDDGELRRKTGGQGPRCRGCGKVFGGVLIHGRCPDCLPDPKQSESP